MSYLTSFSCECSLIFAFGEKSQLYSQIQFYHHLHVCSECLAFLCFFVVIVLCGSGFSVFVFGGGVLSFFLVLSRKSESVDLCFIFESFISVV